MQSVLAGIDARAGQVRAGPDLREAGGERPNPVMHSDLDGWWPDCSFASGMVMALQRSPCLTFTFASRGGLEQGRSDEVSRRVFV